MSRRQPFQMTVSNEYLGTARVIRGASMGEMQAKAQQQLAKWERQEQRERERQAREELKKNLKELAESESEDARLRLEMYRSLLRSSLATVHRLDWSALYDHEPYVRPTFGEPPPNEPDIMVELGVPRPAFFTELLFRSRKEARLEQERRAREVLQQRLDEYLQRQKDFEVRVAALEAEHSRKQAEQHQEIDQFREDYERGAAEAIERYLRLVLERSAYPDEITVEFELQFSLDTGLVVVDYELPRPEDMPSVSHYRFIQSRLAVEPVELKAKELSELYESTVLQITLRTMYEVFASDYERHVKGVVFNGWVTAVDKATGNDFTACVISCQASREAFEERDLARVDPKECVRGFKGLIAGPLAQLAPVRPIMYIDRDDERFVQAREIMDSLDASQNLASMPWEDFEHLVRELFAQIFTKDGAEVRVTQASRDGGVDAIVFDPDPIRGGKFVIQAKRYNAVVPVSAARDLYGTMISEGAVKGILITTSHFGNDSWEFVKDKPITLIDGANLVYLFQEYGREVRIEVGK